ncbi:hypothetical protein [Nocardioides pyridinolyticus]
MRRTILASLVAATLLLAGCGDGDDPEAVPTGTPTDATTSAAADPSASEPAVEPASGFLIDLDRIRMNAPEGWKKNDPLSTFLLQAYDPDSYSHVSLSDLPGQDEPSLEGLAQYTLDIRKRSKQLDPVEIAGVEWYHVAGPNDPYTRFEQFGTSHNDSLAVIEFLLDRDTPAQEQQQIIDSVLASVEWK